MRIGFVGLGTMGTPMVRRLLDNGFRVTVWARRPDAMAPLSRAGAIRAASPADVAAQSEVTVTMVTDTRAVEEVILGEQGVVRGGGSGTLVIDHSTIAPDAAGRIGAELELHGIEMLDAPVSGGS